MAMYTPPNEHLAGRDPAVLKVLKTIVMLDIETLDTEPTALITQIAATVHQVTAEMIEGFQPANSVDTMNEFISPSSQPSRSISASTVLFHVEHSSLQLWQAAVDDSQVNQLPIVLTWLYQLLNNARETAPAGEKDRKNFEVVTKGRMDFDVLNHATKSLGLPDLIKYYENTELRGLMKVCGVEPEKTISHDGLDDCYNQTTSYLECLRIIENGKEKTISHKRARVRDKESL